jgi:hypothetical protein
VKEEIWKQPWTKPGALGARRKLYGLGGLSLMVNDQTKPVKDEIWKQPWTKSGELGARRRLHELGSLRLMVNDQTKPVKDEIWKQPWTKPGELWRIGVMSSQCRWMIRLNGY